MNFMFIDIVDDFTLWRESIQIYRDSFPVWERESEANLLKNIKNRTYKMIVYTKDKEVVGFYILDINPALNYTLFSFLAIKESHRGFGFGSVLCLYAIEYFYTKTQCKWFFLEAEDTVSGFYNKLLFKTLDVDYRIPAFDSQKSIQINLMLIREMSIDRDYLRLIIKDIFIRGYDLKENDIRIEEQLKKV